MNFFHLILILTFFIFLTSCEDVIEVETNDAPQLLVVDAWLNNRTDTQTIRLTLSQPYFDNTFSGGVTDASVIVQNSEGKTFTFESQNNGNYTWIPSEEGELGDIGTTYTLSIDWNGALHTAVSQMNRVPEIDSISQEFRADELGGPDGIYAEFFARDFLGEGDTYWIKTFKNGHFLNKPQEMNIAFDAGFDAGSAIDGLIFIPPLRELVNRIPDPDTEDDSDTPPWVSGDEIRVEIHSMTIDVFAFMDIAREQMTNGDNGIFAIPLANTTGNVLNTTTGEEVLGIFCVSAVSELTRIIE